MNRARLALLLVSALWGTTFVLVKSGLDDASPLVFLALRFACATLATAPLLVGRRLDRAALLRGIPLGLVMAAAYSAQTIGLQSTSPSRSAFLTALNVSLVPLWGSLLLRHRPSAGSLVGLATTLAGVYFLTSPEAGSWSAGDSWTVACAVLFSLHVVLLSRWGARSSMEVLLVVQLAVTALFAGIGTSVEPRSFEPTSNLVVAVLATALLATALTTWLQLLYQPQVDPTSVAILYATEPAFAALFSVLFFGERLGLAAIFGGALIAAGAVWAEASARKSPLSSTGS